MTLRPVSPVFVAIAITFAGCGSPTQVVPSPAASDPQQSGSDEVAGGVSDNTPAAASLPASTHTDQSVKSKDSAAQKAAPAETKGSFREPDLRPQHQAAELAEYGIDIYESRRLRLHTDIEPEIARTLPPLVDAVFEQWVAYFGPLPPARDGSDFQLSAYVMRDQQAFRDAGLLPVNLPVFSHGKHQGQQFWMNDQKHVYYLRHLLLHEATHCFMQTMGGTTIDVPLWYLEGMAELFATHSLDEQERPAFGVIPPRPDEFVGFGRVEMIRQDIEQGKPLTIAQLGELTSRRFRRRQSAYAWSWALCLLAEHSPKYHDLFQELGRRYPAEGFDATYEALFGPIAADFAAEWTLMTRQFAYGFDIERAAIEFQRGRRLSEESVEHHQTTVAADRGWQASGVEVVRDSACHVTANGRITLADDPKPWISEPDGVTIRYAEGLPIGRLVGVIIGEADGSADGRRIVSEVIPLGRETNFKPPLTGTLYLRVNDFWNEISDNRGAYTVTITR